MREGKRWVKKVSKDGDSRESGRLFIESSDEDGSGVKEDDQLSGEGDCLTGWTSQGKEWVKASGTMGKLKLS